MTDVVKKFLNVHLATLPDGARVLEIGSYDVNGKVDVSRFEYIGLDMRDGPNVSVVCNAHKLPFADNYFDCVLCAETLEHDDTPLETIAQIKRVLKKEGMLLVTVPSIGFPKHDYPSDYWRVTQEGLKVWFKDFRIHGIDESDKSLRCVAFK